jgi:hypothetical protein
MWALTTVTTPTTSRPCPRVRALASRDPLAVPSLTRELTQRYMIWDGHVAGARRVDVHPLILPRALHDAAWRAAEGVTRAIHTVARRALHDPDERGRYGLHGDVERLAAASDAAGDDASLVRVDLLLSENGGVQACEINADCPGGHNEALGLPRLARAAGFFAGQNPTVVVPALVRRLAQLAEGSAVGLIYATAYAEDLQVCALIQRELLRRGVQAILAPATAPRLVDKELFIGSEPVRVLYRYFPTEYMQGQKNVGGIAEAVAGGYVRTLTSFSHIYDQSKYAFARAWQGRAGLDEEERRAVEEHIPPTFDVADVSLADLVAEREGWVLKRAYGRVGDEVFVGPLAKPDEWSRLVASVQERRATGESWIAQRFVRQENVPTPWGPRYVTLGAYVLDGSFVGYFARLTPKSHVSHDALCVPVFHLEATEE